MKRLIFMAALALAGCGQGAGEKAEAEYRMASRMILSADEVCAAKRKVEQGYLRDGDEENYQRWRVEAGLACNRADLERL